MIKQYDKALLDKLTKWFGEDVRIVQDRQSLLTTILAEGDDKMRFPLVAVMRTEPPIVLQTASTWMSADGYAVARNDQQTKVIRAVPCRLTYGIAIFDTSREAIDDLWQQLTFLLINNPMLEVSIPYADVEGRMRSTWATIKMSNTEDNSNQSEHLLNGSIYAYEIPITVDDAYLFDAKIGKNVIIDGIEVAIKDVSSQEENVEIVIEGGNEG